MVWEGAPSTLLLGGEERFASPLLARGGGSAKRRGQRRGLAAPARLQVRG